MKPREIFIRSLHRGPVPRPAVGSATSVVTIDLMRKVDVFFPDVHLDAEKLAGLGAAAVTVLGHDNVMPLFSVCHESAALGCRVDWGALDRMPSIRGQLYQVGDPIVVPDDLLDREGCRVALEAIRLLRKRLGDDYAVVGKVFGPWTLGYHVFGVEPFLLNTLDQPDAIRRAMDVLKEVTVRFAAAQIDAGADALCLGDHATRDLCSPAAYRDFLAPLHAELVERIACPLVLHICGDTSDRIGMIAETGVACFHFDSKVPAGEARKLAGDRLALMGGTSNLKIIRNSDPDGEELARRDGRAKIAAGIDVIGPECAVPLDAPYRNLAAMAVEVKRFGR